MLTSRAIYPTFKKVDEPVSPSADGIGEDGLGKGAANVDSLNTLLVDADTGLNVEVSASAAGTVLSTTRAAISDNLSPESVYRLGLSLRVNFIRKASQRGINESDAEDVFQNVMLSFLEKHERLDSNWNIKGLIWQRLNGAIKDHLRSKGPLSQKARRRVKTIEKIFLCLG